MARRNDHTREELQSLMLNNAVKIVENEGFQKLTARYLAKDIGYTPGSIYNIFGSMDGLYIAVNAQTLDHLFECLSDPKSYPKNAELLEKLKKMAEIYMGFAKKNKALWLMLFNSNYSNESIAPDWYREKITALFEVLEGFLAPLFTRSETQARAVAARALWSSIHGICLMEETNKTALIGEGNALDMTDCLIDNFVSGLKSRQN